MANVHHFIKTLTGGYNFEVNEESTNISQGEKQLLTIARAILKDPRIIILDEATSSVDTRLEKMLQEAMHRVMDGRTSFVIAHRLSTVRNADLILVVDHGDIVEQGTHEELLAKKGVYEKLYHLSLIHIYIFRRQMGIKLFMPSLSLKILVHQIRLFLLQTGIVMRTAMHVKTII